MSHAPSSPTRRLARTIGAMLALTIAASSAFAQQAADADPPQRSAVVTIDWTNGDRLQLALQNADYASDDFDGTLVFVGTHTFENGHTTDITLTTTIDAFESAANAWRLAGDDDMILSSDGTQHVLAVTTSTTSDAEQRVTTHTVSLAGATNGSSTIVGDYAALLQHIDTARDIADRRDFAVALTHFIAAVTGQTDAAIAVGSDAPSYLQCWNNAVYSCQKRLNIGADLTPAPCMESFAYHTNGSCGFDCFSRSECRAAQNAAALSEGEANVSD